MTSVVRAQRAHGRNRGKQDAHTLDPMLDGRVPATSGVHTRSRGAGTSCSPEGTELSPEQWSRRTSFQGRKRVTSVHDPNMPFLNQRSRAPGPPRFHPMASSWTSRLQVRHQPGGHAPSLDGRKRRTGRTGAGCMSSRESSIWQACLPACTRAGAGPGPYTSRADRDRPGGSAPSRPGPAAGREACKVPTRGWFREEATLNSGPGGKQAWQAYKLVQFQGRKCSTRKKS